MTVAILGAGIAGLAAAIALRARGLEVEVFERRARPTSGGDADAGLGVDGGERGRAQVGVQPAPLGAGIVCWPNACFVLGQLGVLERILAAGHRIVEMRRLSERGEYLGSLPVDRIDGALGHPSVAIRRVDLHEVLLEEAERRGARVHHGRTVVDVVDALGALEEAEVVFDDGTRIRAELILGADGRMTSPARRYVAPGCTPQYQHFVNWIGVVEDVRLQLEPGVVLDVWGRGQRFGVVPLSTHRAYWAGGAWQAEPRTCPPDRLPTRLRQRFSGWPQPVRAIVEGCERGVAGEVHVYDQDPLPSWHRRNVLLLGDAAHAALPTSGQGACQALEDAWHLAQLLERASSVDDVGSQFFDLRASKTAAITQVGRTLARDLFDPEPAAQIRRDARSLATDFEAMARGVGALWSRGLPMPGTTGSSP